MVDAGWLVPLGCSATVAESFFSVAVSEAAEDTG